LSLSSRSVSVSVVVVSHNEGDHLRRTVDCLLAGLPPDGEVVVIDDGSTDGSAAGLDSGYLGVTVVRPEARLGISAARNLGAAQARGDVLIFSDAHVTASPGWLEPLSDALARPDVGVAGPIVSALGEPEARGHGFQWCDAALNVEWLPWQGAEPHPVPMMAGCFLAMRRDVFAAVGGFDPGMVLYGAEDAEICLHLWTLGYECILVPDVTVDHLFRAAHPYAVSWDAMLHNVLRVAVVHFGPERTQRVVRALTGNDAFPAAFALLAASNAWERRSTVRAARRFDDDWFCERFGMAC